MPASFTLTHASQPAHRLHLPTAWPEVTTAQYLALLAPDAPWLAVLTGLAPDALAALPAADAQQLAECLAFALDPAPLRALLPTPDGYEVGHCLHGLLMRFEQFLGQHPDAPALAHGAYLCALYRQPALPSTLNDAQVAAAHAAVLAAPITATYADAQRLLASYLRAKDGTTPPGPPQPGGWRLVPAPRNGLRARLRTFFHFRFPSAN